MKKNRFLFYLIIWLQLVGITNAKISYYPLLTNSENLKVNYASKFKKNSENQPNSSPNNTSNITTNLILQGIIDFSVPEGGANGRALHFLATGEIADLSIYGFGVANGGCGSDGQEYTFEAIPVAAGDDILVLRNTTAMSNYLGDCYAAFEHIYTNSGVNGSGDDAIELFMNGSVVETFGDIQKDGTGELWEYTDSWAYKIGNNWTYGGINCTDNSTSIFNTSCLYPICSDYSTDGCTNHFACNYDETANTNDGSCTFFETGSTSLTFPLYYNAVENYDNGEEYETYPVVMNEDGTLIGYDEENYNYRVCENGASYSYTGTFYDGYEGTGTWDSSSLEITGAYYDSFFEETISFTYTYIPIPTCTSEEKLLTVLGGAYLEEKSWTITECDGTEIASGGAPYAQCINLGENYIINLVDDEEDGWDGTEMTIADQTYTIQDGATESYFLGTCITEVCTDTFACNYDETANTNDGSCAFFESGSTNLTFPLNYAASEAYSNGNEYNTYTIVYNQDGTVSDSNNNNFTYQVCSDGSSFNYDEDIGGGYQGTWDPANFNITGNFYDSDEDDTISFTYTYIPTCTSEEKLLTVLGGAYLDEKSWAITECDGTEIASGGAPYAQCINLGDNYIINLVDSFEDGWDGTEMNIAGTSYTMTDNVASKVIPIGSCSIEGCTNNTAPNYNEQANMDDGSCEIASGWYLINNDVTVSSDNTLFVNNNLVVNNTGNLTIKSDANSSGSLLVAGTATGNIIYERYIPDTAWHLVSAPVTSQDINSFATADNAIKTKVDKYAIANYTNSNSTGSKWEYFTTSSLPTAGNFKSGQGYSLNRTSAGNYTFKGQMATANVNYTLSSSSNDNDYWTCVGNPYPSFLLASDGDNPSLLKNNENVMHQNYKALYIWDESQFIVINQTSEKTYLAPGQGIMVNAINGSQTFTFSKDLQSHQSENNTFYRSLNHPTINLFLSNQNTKVRTTVKYVDECTTDLDPGYDAGALIEGNPELIINTQLLQGDSEIDHTLQCLPNNELDSYTIPISVFAKAETELMFSASHTDFSEDVYIYLKDLLTGEVTDLKQDEYQITTQTDLEGIGRFYLFTTPEELNFPEELVQPITIYNTERELIISGMQKNENSSLQIYNAIGQEVFAKQLNTEKIRINLPELPTGVYMAKVKNNKKLITSKIILKN